MSKKQTKITEKNVSVVVKAVSLDQTEMVK